MKSGIEKGLGDKLNQDSSYYHYCQDNDRLIAEKALVGSPAKSVVPIKGLSGLKELLQRLAVNLTLTVLCYQFLTKVLVGLWGIP